MMKQGTSPVEQLSTTPSKLQGAHSYHSSYPKYVSGHVAICILLSIQVLSSNPNLNGSSQFSADPIKSVESKMVVTCFALTKHSKDESGICFPWPAVVVGLMTGKCDQDDWRLCCFDGVLGLLTRGCIVRLNGDVSRKLLTITDLFHSYLSSIHRRHNATGCWFNSCDLVRTSHLRR